MKTLDSFEALAEAMIRPVEQLVHVHDGIVRCLEIVERDARRRIGHYQPETGPFQDWAELTPGTQDERERAGFTPNDPLLRDGTHILNTLEHEAHELEGVVGSKDVVAAYMEFGTPTVPPRPFLGPAAYVSRHRIERILGRAVVRGLTAGSDIHASLGYDADID